MPVRLFAKALATLFLILATACSGDDDSSIPAPLESGSDEATAPAANTPDEPASGDDGANGDEDTTHGPATTAPDDAEGDESEHDAEFVASLGGYIYFTSERDDMEGQFRDDIYMMRPDGSELRRLTETNYNEWWPRLSPDGSAMVFGRNYYDGRGDPRSGHSPWGIVVWPSSGEPVDITDNREFHSGSSWSPDGTRFLFSSGRGSSAGFNDQNLYELGQTNLWVMDVAGGNVMQLTEGGAGSGAWSPDGERIVFTQTRGDSDKHSLFIMNADGASVELLSDGDGSYARPHWSPDGGRIVFENDRHGESEIFVIDVDGANEKRLTDNEARDSFARWSPDGEAIVFTSNRDGNLEVYVMAADGSSQSNISQHEALDAYPSWSEHRSE